jgi:glucosamine 6-phosphate synthetase-like amidotransferase/phosphosugar isomerase protein
MSDDGNVVAVHNGIIENYQELKDKLIRNGYEFYSSTDTEVAVKLVDYYYKKYLGTPVDAINHAMVRIRGSYALAIMFKDYPGEIYVARKDSPMILGVENGESYIASDVPAILKYTKNVYYIGNLEMARIRKGEITFYNLDGDEIQKEPKTKAETIVKEKLTTILHKRFSEYYKHDIHYQEEMQRVQNAQDLPNKPLVSKLENEVTITFPVNFDPKKITGNVALYRPSNKKLDFQVKLALTEPVLHIPKTNLVGGSWDINMEWQYEGKAYLTKETIYIK